METVDNKLGYLKGLLEKAGSGLGDESRTLFGGILDVLGELDRSSREMTDLFAELNDYVESIDDDLAELEDGGSYPAQEDPQGPRLHAVPSQPRDYAAVCPACGRIFIAPSADRSRCVCPHCGRACEVTPVAIDGIPAASLSDD